MAKPYSVPFIDFKRDPESLIHDQLEVVEQVLRSGWWVLGDQVQAFESAWAKTCQATGCVGVGNGLDAIEIGLRALGVGPGDEVITTAVTAFATTLAIQRCGASPVFADIDPTTACLCPSSVEASITPKTKAVVVVHLYGRFIDLKRLRNLCDGHSLYLVEDCAQAHLARSGDYSAGEIGDFAAWSFYPTKNLGAIGDAGALTSNNQKILDLASQMRNYGQRDRYHHDTAGMNSRLDELQAAILLKRLPMLREWTNRRRAIAYRYWSEIKNSNMTFLAFPSTDDSHVHHLFVLTSQYRDVFQTQLLEMGIQTLIHYPVPCHQQKALGVHRLSPSGLPFTETHCLQCLSLPIHPYLTEDEVSKVIEACNNVHV